MILLRIQGSEKTNTDGLILSVYLRSEAPYWRKSYRVLVDDLRRGVVAEEIVHSQRWIAAMHVEKWTGLWPDLAALEREALRGSGRGQL